MHGSLRFHLVVHHFHADKVAPLSPNKPNNDVASYSALDRFLATIGGAEFGEFDEHSQKLIMMSLKIMDFTGISFTRLVEVREKEKSSGGAHLKVLRHKYLSSIKDYCSKLSNAKTQQEIEEIERLFESE